MKFYLDVLLISTILAHTTFAVVYMILNDMQKAIYFTLFAILLIELKKL